MAGIYEYAPLLVSKDSEQFSLTALAMYPTVAHSRSP
jgi:hypothetical protein